MGPKCFCLRPDLALSGPEYPVNTSIERLLRLYDSAPTHLNPNTSEFRLIVFMHVQVPIDYETNSWIKFDLYETFVLDFSAAESEAKTEAIIFRFLEFISMGCFMLTWIIYFVSMKWHDLENQCIIHFLLNYNVVYFTISILYQTKYTFLFGITIGKFDKKFKNMLHTLS